MEYLVTMTTQVPDGTSEGPSKTSAPARRHVRASWRGRGTSCAYGARRCNRANGERLAYSPPTTVSNSRKSSPRCRCGCGAPMRSLRSRLTRMTRPDRPKSPEPPRPNPGQRVSDHVHRGRSRGHRPRDRRCDHPARSRSGAGARRARIPGATLDAAPARPRAGPVAGLPTRPE